MLVMLKTFLALSALVISGYVGFCLRQPPTVHAQIKTGGAPLRKTWGAVRGTFADPRTGEAQLVFEDSAGTVRIARIFIADGSRTDCEAGYKCAEIVAELHRD
jgi:hypothetical protein